MRVNEEDGDKYDIYVKEKSGKTYLIKVDKIKYSELVQDEVIRIKSAKEDI